MTGITGKAMEIAGVAFLEKSKQGTFGWVAGYSFKSILACHRAPASVNCPVRMRSVG